MLPRLWHTNAQPQARMQPSIRGGGTGGAFTTSAKIIVGSGHIGGTKDQDTASIGMARQPPHALAARHAMEAAPAPLHMDSTPTSSPHTSLAPVTDSAHAFVRTEPHDLPHHQHHDQQQHHGRHEVSLLEQALAAVQAREARDQAPPADDCSECPAQIGSPLAVKAFSIKTFDPLPPLGQQCFPQDRYVVVDEATVPPSPPVALMVRNHQLEPEEVGPTVCCVSRFGSGGFSNVPVARMTELGIPVFTTPAANANAVKELVVCALLLASRGILEGHAHVNNVIYKEEEMDHDRIEHRIEQDRPMFIGTEISGKTLGVIGLGNVGSRVVNAALALGMKVVGFDPWISMEAIWKLPGDQMTLADSLDELLTVSDYITVHVHYFNRATHHLLNASNLQLCKHNVHLLNFSPASIIDGKAVRDMFSSGRLTGKYVSDFADPHLTGHPRHLVRGAATPRCVYTRNSAVMAATAITEFLEQGTIRNSVNFPDTALPRMPRGSGSSRLCIVVQRPDEPGVLGQITSFLGDHNINIEQQISATRGDIAYLLIDVSNVDDPANMQVELAKACRYIVSSRYIDSSTLDPVHHDPQRPSTFLSISRLIWDHDDCSSDCEQASWGSTASLMDDMDCLVEGDEGFGAGGDDCQRETWGEPEGSLHDCEDEPGASGCVVEEEQGYGVAEPASI